MAKCLYLQIVRPCLSKNFTLPEVKLGQSYVSTIAQKQPAAVIATLKHVITVEDRDITLRRLSASGLLRSYFLSKLFASQLAFKAGLMFMKTVANSRLRILNPDTNPVLRAMVRPTIYDHFCAGINEKEVQHCITTMKEFGFTGAVLAYAREIEVGEDSKMHGYSGGTNIEVEVVQWRDANLETLKMTGAHDGIAMKLTGAGPAIVQMLIENKGLPSCFHDALDSICQLAESKDCRILIDSEQQVVQAAIDDVAIDCMRRWNVGRKPLIYNTIQAYLKDAKSKVSHQMKLAQDEGWSLGIKLVRGAYIASDERSLIHDTKADTDASYNGIVRDLLSGKIAGLDTDKSLPKYEIILAGHNADTVRTALSFASDLSKKGALKVHPEFAQLQGMADDVGCEIIQAGQDAKTEGEVYVPRVYKYLLWGRIQECMQYLVRRAIENQSATERMKDGVARYGKEIRRRTFARLDVSR